MKTGKNHTNKGIQLINTDGKLSTNQQSIADSFNTHFLTIADKINCNIKNDKTSLNSNNPVHWCHKNFKFCFTNMTLYYTTKEIEKIIKSLKSNNAHQYVEIHTKILKVSTRFFIFRLTFIFNKSLSSGIFPS